MAHRVCRAALATIAAAICLAAGNTAHAQYYGPPGWTSPEPNYYAAPTGEDGLTAAMYPCPRPTPPLTGQTLITYGPLAPQQMMNVHWNRYVTDNGCGNYTTTSILYGHHYHILPHPTLRNQAPGLHTPAHVSCPF
jgi:hypothetical protein